MKKALRSYVKNMEMISDKLDNIPMSGKTGAKIGWKIGCVLAFNPITAPIATGVAIGVGTLYGTYKIAKHIVDKEDKA